ncbi:UDP-glucose 4-epimerase GalE [Lysinibacillus piscis]|uniref:UDP-glucose 4-epimerase n=1 Tax=Lysinibacillus piscis TaxID=2518931 RepID=A0ABQ5NHH5_9BACI|nr:UDP-glucose 4-epimerase GalE [Lysinibacillus sp. KH24]GLC87823.1 UDP-glucose 4-epimerase GalE [Lysinibacillus sp. KH24]
MIAVVGGAGYIGSHTVKYLVEQSEPVVVFDNLSTGHQQFVPNDVPFVEGDLASFEDLHKLFTNYPNIHTVIHFAAFAYVGESVVEPAKYYRNNLVNTVNLLDTMLVYNVKNIVFSSTCATYGNPIALPITEEHPQNPINPYGRTKLMMEQLMDDYSTAYGINFAALRYFNAAGAAEDCEIGEWHEPEPHLIPLILDVALGKSEKINVFGSDFDTPDGTCIRDYIHVTDLADAHYRAAKYLIAEKQNLQLNLANGAGYSNLEIIQMAEKVTRIPITYQLTDRRLGDPGQLIGCADKAKNIIHWEPNYNLQQIIETAWAWHQKKFGGKV